jgi:rod shape-determining protein MreD
MSPTKIALHSAFLLLLFVLQDSIISLIHFPIAGFSLYLGVLFALLASQDRNNALVLGFIGGLILDLTPSSTAPFGQWGLVITLAAYAVTQNREMFGDFLSSPLYFLAYLNLCIIGSLALYFLLGQILGESNGSLGRFVIIVLGNAIWTSIFIPLLLPAINKVEDLISSVGEQI